MTRICHLLTLLLLLFAAETTTTISAQELPTAVPPPPPQTDRPQRNWSEKRAIYSKRGKKGGSRFKKTNSEKKARKAWREKFDNLSPLQKITARKEKRAAFQEWRKERYRQLSEGEL